MTRKIKVAALVKIDPVDNTFLGLELFGNTKHLQENELPKHSYTKMQQGLKQAGMYRIPADENNKVDMIIVSSYINRGERKAK